MNRKSPHTYRLVAASLVLTLSVPPVFSMPGDSPDRSVPVTERNNTNNVLPNSATDFFGDLNSDSSANSPISSSLFSNSSDSVPGGKLFAQLETFNSKASNRQTPARPKTTVEVDSISSGSSTVSNVSASSYEAIVNAGTGCTEFDIAEGAPGAPINTQTLIAACGESGMAILKGGSRRWLRIGDVKGTFASANYIFAALGKKGIAVFRKSDVLQGSSFTYSRLVFPDFAPLDPKKKDELIYDNTPGSILDTRGVAVASGPSGQESYMYVSSFRGVSVIPFHEIQASLAGSSTREIQVDALPLLKVTNAHGIEILNETRAPQFQTALYSPYDYLTLAVASGWGQVRLYTLHDPGRPQVVKNGNIWTPFMIKRGKKLDNDEYDWEYRDSKTDLRSLSVVNGPKGDLVITDMDGAIERMNLGDYIIITSTTQLGIMQYLSEKVGTDAAVLSGMFFAGPDALDGAYSAFSLIQEGIVAKWLNPAFEKFGHDPININTERLLGVGPRIRKPDGSINYYDAHDVAEKVHSDRLAREWRDRYATILDPTQIQVLDKIIEKGRGNGRVVLMTVALFVLQGFIGARTAPIIAKLDKAPDFSQKWKMTKWMFRWFGYWNAKNLNSLYSLIGVNVAFRAINIEHFWRTQMWAWVDAVIIAWNMQVVRKDEPTSAQLFSPHMFDDTHVLFIHEQYWFDLILNLTLYSLLMPPTLADKGARGYKLGRSSTFMGASAQYIWWITRKFGGRYKGIISVNMLMRAWSDFIVQLGIKEGIFKIPVSSKRWGFDMAYSLSWVNPSINTAWLAEDGVNAIAKSTRTTGPLVGIGAELIAAIIHGIVSGIPIEYGILVGYDQPSKIVDLLGTIQTYPVSLTEESGRVSM